MDVSAPASAGGCTGVSSLPHAVATPMAASVTMQIGKGVKADER
jgi:hypothetical protein